MRLGALDIPRTTQILSSENQVDTNVWFHSGPDPFFPCLFEDGYVQIANSPALGAFQHYLAAYRQGYRGPPNHFSCEGWFTL